jgi:hypothetical protein
VSPTILPTDGARPRDPPHAPARHWPAWLEPLPPPPWRPRSVVRLPGVMAPGREMLEADTALAERPSTVRNRLDRPWEGGWRLMRRWPSTSVPARSSGKSPSSREQSSGALAGIASTAWYRQMTQPGLHGNNGQKRRWGRVNLVGPLSDHTRQISGPPARENVRVC